MNAAAKEGGPAPWVRILRGGMLAALSPDGRAGHRVRAWPDLTPETWDARRGGWRPDPAAADALAGAFKFEVWEDVYAEDYVPDVPRLASTAGRWSVRVDGQFLMDHAYADDPVFVDELWDTRGWELVEAFKATLPPEVRAVIEGFRLPPFEVLRALALAPGLVNLAWRNFPVMWHLARAGCEKGRLAELARAARRDLMRALGLPPAAFGFLARLPLRRLQPAQIPVLAEAVEQPGFGKALLHLNPVPPLVVKLAQERETWDLLSPSLIHQLVRCSREPHSVESDGAENFVADLTSVARGLQPAQRRRLRSTGELAQLTAAEARPPWKPNPDDPTPLPPPPVPGSATLVPIRTVGEAVREGRVQGNCVGTEFVLEHVLAGRWALYRSEPQAPERVTVLVESCPDEPTTVTDVRGPGDFPVGLATLRWVAAQLGLDVAPFWLPSDAVFLPPGQTCAVRAPTECMKS